VLQNFSLSTLLTKLRDGIELQLALNGLAAKEKTPEGTYLDDGNLTDEELENLYGQAKKG
jgi:hypothetical protein